MDSIELSAITQPGRVWTRAEVLQRPSPVPNGPGVYGWYFRDLPVACDTTGCTRSDDLTLLYVGISPHAPSAASGTPSNGTLRKRIRTHFSGNASASTLRLTLGLVLGLQLRIAGSGRFTFGPDEAALNAWMADHARVTWVETPEPWLAEEHLIATLDLPLNVQQNGAHPYWGELSGMRRAAKAAARHALSADAAS